MKHVRLNKEEPPQNEIFPKDCNVVTFNSYYNTWDRSPGNGEFVEGLMETQGERMWTLLFTSN